MGLCLFWDLKLQGSADTFEYTGEKSHLIPLPFYLFYKSLLPRILLPDQMAILYFIISFEKYFSASHVALFSTVSLSIIFVISR